MQQRAVRNMWIECVNILTNGTPVFKAENKRVHIPVGTKLKQISPVEKAMEIPHSTYAVLRDPASFKVEHFQYLGQEPHSDHHVFVSFAVGQKFIVKRLPT